MGPRDKPEDDGIRQTTAPRNAPASGPAWCQLWVVSGNYFQPRLARSMKEAIKQTFKKAIEQGEDDQPDDHCDHFKNPKFPQFDPVK